jgi:hypothetical protein
MTLIDVSVVVVVLAVLACLLLPALSAARKKAQLINCVGDLMQIGLGCRIWEGNHTNLYPMSISTNLGGTLEYVATGATFRHFQIMSNELSTPKVLVCPADVRLPAENFGFAFGNTNISYFIGVDADDSRPQDLLSGDRNIVGGNKLADGILEITTNQSVGWSSEMHNSVGNIGRADGSVQHLTADGLRQLLQQTCVATNRLALP